MSKSKFDKVYKKLNEAVISNKTAFTINKRVEDGKKSLDKVKTEFDKTIAALSSDRELYVSHNKIIEQTFDQLYKSIANLQADIKSRM